MQLKYCGLNNPTKILPLMHFMIVCFGIKISFSFTYFLLKPVLNRSCFDFRICGTSVSRSERKARTRKNLQPPHPYFVPRKAINEKGSIRHLNEVKKKFVVHEIFYFLNEVKPCVK